MRRGLQITEAELAKALVDGFTEAGLDVYEEVQPWSGGGICDIVIREGPRIHAIEVKRSLGLSVIAQARRWIPYAHRCSIAVPRAQKQSIARDLAVDIAAIYGLGVIEGTRGAVSTKPKTHRIKDRTLVEALSDGHKTHAKAGSNRGGHYTVFRMTCEELRRFIRAKPGCTLKEAIETIPHHYASAASARGSLLGLIYAGVVGGIRVDETEKTHRLFPEEK